LKTLLIDNYDSFTFSLYQLLAEVNGELPIVIKNDELSWSEISQLDIDNIVLSPGPGRPDSTRDFGVCADVIKNATLPLLGVCLGHQGIASWFGGKLEQATETMHGRSSEIYHNGADIFDNIPSPYTAVRYHSLVVKDLPKDLEVLAKTEDGVLMALKHRTRPIWSVQYHPESICTDYGRELLVNFKRLSEQYLGLSGSKRKLPFGQPSLKDFLPRANLDFKVEVLDFFPDPERVFEALYSQSEVAFWLDSSSTSNGARFSYMGDTQGKYSAWFEYSVEDKNVTWHPSLGVERRFPVNSLFDFLKTELNSRIFKTDGLPFDFNGGFVGYFGYELKAECGYENRNPLASQPDASFILADRFIVFDHLKKQVYLLSLSVEFECLLTMAWLSETKQKLSALLEDENDTASKPSTFSCYDLEVEKRCSDTRYVEKIAEIQERIRDGETYEACLTNMLAVKTNKAPFELYKDLRQSSPAPYASYLSFPSFKVLSASPEQFLQIDERGMVSSKPIKGTRPRGASPEEDMDLRAELALSEKDRSENLMIVDLLRSDLGSISEIGSVKVSKLFDVETYANVHQMVSTINSKISSKYCAIDCIRACFPGGSMTGAPKKRTLEILDQLEEGPRGIYSGAIGFLALNGSAHLNIVIRSLVLSNGLAEFGVGGAIVDLSVAEDELEETRVKARGVLRALSTIPARDIH